ncbi:MAG: M43 family zinc metalloprotease [Chitinophagales bacterium]
MFTTFKPIFIYCISILLFSLSLQSQTIVKSLPKEKEYIRCATMENHTERLKSNPKRETLDQFEAWLQKRITSNQNAGLQKTLYTLPVVVHIIHNGEAVGTGSNISEAQVQSQIDVLNEDFRKLLNTPGYNDHPDGADIEIEFCMAELDPDGNTLPELGIDRVNRNTEGYSSPPYVTNCTTLNTSYINNTIKPGTYWNPDNYFNMWVMNLGCGLLGYAQFPNSSGLSGLNANGGDADTDGVVMGYQYFGSTDKGNFPSMSSPYDKGRTATHEIGHWLGLRHIWGDSNCGNDYCADTPTQAGDSSGCPNTTTCDGVKDMVENYMDYSYDACMNVFTEDQKTRMVTVMQNSPRRGILQNSTVCSIPVGPPTASFSADKTEICPSVTVQFTDKSAANPAATSWNWNFPGGTPSSSTQQNPSVTYNSIGSYSVSLTVGNGNTPNDTETTNNYITVSNPTGEDTPYAENFEVSANNTWTAVNPDNDVTWADYSGSAASNCTDNGSNAVFMDNFTNDINNTTDTYTNQFNLSELQAPIILTFDVAYARYNGSFSDGLEVNISDLCNGTTTKVYDKSGTTLASAPDHTSAFVPDACDEWRTETIDLSAYTGSVIGVNFVNVSGYGNLLYLDNINITGTTCTPSNWYADTDSDTYGDTASSLSECDQPEGYVANNTDCNDSDANNWLACNTCVDNDEDGYYTGCDAYTSINGPDCNDNDGNLTTDCSGSDCTDGASIQYSNTNSLPSSTHVSEHIEAGNLGDNGNVEVQNGQNVGFKAGNYITLQPGFEVTFGGVFESLIEACNQNAKVTQLKTVAEELQLTSMDIFPNPFVNQIHINYNIATESRVNLYLLDINGKKIKQILEPQQQEKGTYTVDFEPCNLEVGMYICVLETNQSRTAVKVLKR